MTKQKHLTVVFRWMNNLLLRELPLRATIRLWDTYLAEKDGFSKFHLYVCAAFLIRWKQDLSQRNDFQVRLCFFFSGIKSYHKPLNEFRQNNVLIVLYKEFSASMCVTVFFYFSVSQRKYLLIWWKCINAFLHVKAVCYI